MLVLFCSFSFFLFFFFSFFFFNFVPWQFVAHKILPRKCNFHFLNCNGHDPDK